MDQELYECARLAGESLKRRDWMLATAESCTGGWIGQAMTMVPGSSAWFDRGFITYTNRAKMEMLGVKADTLRDHGAVSQPVVREMAAGAVRHSAAHIAVAVSGVAGPDGGTALKPVGTVCIAWFDRQGELACETLRFAGDRDAVRRQTVLVALSRIPALLA